MSLFSVCLGAEWHSRQGVRTSNVAVDIVLHFLCIHVCGEQQTHECRRDRFVEEHDPRLLLMFQLLLPEQASIECRARRRILHECLHPIRRLSAPERSIVKVVYACEISHSASSLGA